MSLVFLDTSPVIYLLEGHAQYMPKVAAFLHDSVQEGKSFVTSPITFSEFGLQPSRLGRFDLLEAYWVF